MQVYAIRALFSGPLIPCACDPLPYKTTETHAAMWNAIRALAGDGAADMERSLAIDFEQDAINAAPSAFPRAAFVG